MSSQADLHVQLQPHAQRNHTRSGGFHIHGPHASLHVDVLLPRVWELRKNLTAYDAVYVALAEALDMPLVTCDANIARAPGHRARVDVI
jgi:hypothetical protein